MADASQSETLIIDGQAVPVDRADYRSMIESTVRLNNCTDEEAWERVKDHLVAALTEENRRGGRRRPGNTQQAAQPASAGTGAATRAPAQPTGTGPNRPEIIRRPGGRYVLRLYGAPISAVPADAIPEALAEKLSRSRKSLMEMAIEGEIEIEGEHDDAALLRAAAPSGVFDLEQGIDPLRQEAIDAVNQRQLQYPLHREKVRILPTDFSRTSLFHVASNNSKRRFYLDEMLGKIGDSIRIEYRGEELRHDDELVFMQLLHVARGKRPYQWMHFNISQFFRGSRGTKRILSVKDTESVAESLKRLRHGMLIVTNTNTGKFFICNLIKELQGDPANQSALIDPIMVLLCSSFAAINTDHLFSTSGVSRQILKYLSAIPSKIERLHPINVTSLFELCYGTIDSLLMHYREDNPEKPEQKVRIAISKKVSDFRRITLPTALEDLKRRGAIAEVHIDEVADKVTIIRNLSTITASVESMDEPAKLPSPNEPT
jgi:hypothetical protein